MKFVLTQLTTLLLWCSPALCQTGSIEANYDQAYHELKEMLDGQKELSFKKAVFLTENAYLDNKMNYADFNEYIQKLTLLATGWMKYNPMPGYRHADSINVLKNHAIFKILKDTIKVYTSDTTAVAFLPYKYDFEDFFGRVDWTKMFVTKLMASRTGNCHSFPFFYKILADELGAKCWLSFAPNHIYIKNRCGQIGWYNTELTSGQFPLDAWITASGYVTLDAIRSGIYMDTLSEQQAIAQCALDLAKGYERRTKNAADSFVIKCCDLVLQYHPLNIAAMIYKAETLRRQYATRTNPASAISNNIFADMQALYVKVLQLGYREMPESMYLDWLRSVNNEKEKYNNKHLINTLNGN